MIALAGQPGCGPLARFNVALHCEARYNPRPLFLVGAECMKFRIPEKLLIILAAAIMALPATLFAQGGGSKHSYRLTPPLRLAARPVDRPTPPGVSEADPFKPRDPKKRSTTLALQGYCLVSLRDHQQWVQGSPQVQAILGGKVYLFSSPRARDIFLAAPELYLPVLDGDCLVSFAETNERVAGKLECGLVHKRRVYFFADQSQLRAFQSAPDEYENADLVDGGQCVVSKLTENRYVAGLPATIAMVDGRRYYFASAFHRLQFVKNPEPFLVLPLRNPLAAAKAEVPAYAEVLNASSGDFGMQAPPQATAATSPSKLVKRAPSTKKAAKKGENEEPENHEDFMHNRAMAGYCPVSIRTQNTWRRGKIKYRHTYDGKLYFLGGAEELAAFQGNPQLYAPVLSGDSVVALANEYERVPGSVFHAYIYKDRLYLFESEDERKLFRENPTQFENADLASQGYCVVSRLDDKQEIAGSAEFETLYLGKRYRLVTDAYLQKFLANPKVYAEQ
jgi:YHS domain-containing protein